jgi:hypothetical protein
MAIPQSLLNRLRYVNALVFLSNEVKVYRPETFNDEYGGTYTDYRLLGTFPSRFVHDTYKEGPVGEGIQPSDEYRFIFGMNPGIEYMDKLVIPNDNHSNRYFLVISVDDTTSEGMFNTAKCVERYN